MLCRRPNRIICSLTTDREGDGRRAMASIDIGRNRWRTAALIAAPAVLLAALVAHPFLCQACLEIYEEGNKDRSFALRGRDLDTAEQA
jgi:hypothetical protein